MISSPSSAKRHIIPRWRSFASTVASGELGSSKQFANSDPASPVHSEFQKRKNDWHKSPSELTAAELVESAIVWGFEDAASDAAQFLANVHANVTPLVRRQSQQLLERLHKSGVTPTVQSKPSLREQLRETPDDAVLWVELALRQIISGANDNAVRSMRTALQLAPNNRFVLRSAARLFSHLHAPDEGYYVLRKSSATEYDPWLMAAEIAMAGRIDKKPIFLRKSLALLEANPSARLDLSELAGAAATTFLDGDISKRHARRLFQQSLGTPTDNAVAQAEWASQASGERFLEIEKVPGFRSAKEAQSLHAYNVGDFGAALTSAKEWIAEEPFSGRAFSAAAAAANTMDDYRGAIQICEEGIRHDGKSANLRNSLAFALACSDRLEEAEQALSDMKVTAEDAVSDLVAEANRGLIALKKRDFSEGEALYNKAISGFRRRGSEYLATCALAYFARESLKSGNPKADEIHASARQAVLRRKNPVAERVLAQIKK